MATSMETETGAQLVARLESRRSLRDIEPRLFPDDSGPDHGEVVELHGFEGTGKTELLYHLLCRCVLPREAGGLCVDVVFIDTDSSLDLLRLVTILEARLTTGLSTSPELCLEEALRSCLCRLLVVHVSSSSQLLLTLHYLETSLCSRPSLSLLLIDSISAFYWLDRSGGGLSIGKQEEKLRKCSQLLGRLLRDYRITVFSSSHAVRKSYRNTASSSASSWSDYEQPYLCRNWQQLVTHRLLCSRSGANMATGAHKENSQQVFTVHCTSSKSKSSRGSSFYVTDGGVVFL